VEGMSGTFVQSFASPTDLTPINITLYSTDINLEKIYTFKVVGKVDPSKFGVNIAEL
jgi:hypothetical protein